MDVHYTKLDIALLVLSLILLFVLLAGANRRRLEQAELQRYRIGG